jgi:preprotein translocase subunit YajC
LNPIIFFALMLVLFWVLIVLPQRRRRQKQADLLKELESGDEVITAGGVYGTVREVAEDYVVLEIAADTRIRVAKASVAVRTTPELEPAEPPETSLP